MGKLPPFPVCWIERTQGLNLAAHVVLKNKSHQGQIRGGCLADVFAKVDSQTLNQPVQAALLMCLLK